LPRTNEFIFTDEARIYSDREDISGYVFFCFLFLFAKIESKRLYFSKIEGQVSLGSNSSYFANKMLQNDFEVDIFTFKYNFTAQTSKKLIFQDFFVHREFVVLLV